MSRLSGSVTPYFNCNHCNAYRTIGYDDDDDDCHDDNDCHLDEHNEDVHCERVKRICGWPTPTCWVSHTRGWGHCLFSTHPKGLISDSRGVGHCLFSNYIYLSMSQLCSFSNYGDPIFLAAITVMHKW